MAAYTADQMECAQTLWAEFAPAISRTLLSYERDATLREDLLQDLFLAILGSVERATAAANPKAYVLRIAHNVASDHIARRLKHAWVELDPAPPDPNTDPAGAGGCF
jgi:RNA polymerase sigma-70 factor, ECF subfamily